MSVSVQFGLGQFASDFCWQSPQQYAAALVALLSGTIAGNFSGVIISSTAPGVTDQDKAWLKLDSNGRPDRLYVYQGVWLSLNPRGANSAERMIWTDTEANLWAYDGGDGSDPSTSAPTATTGAMWQRDTNFDFKVPVGIGTNSVSYDGNAATVLAVGGTGGVERLALAATEMPPHQHLEAIYVTADDAGEQAIWTDANGHTNPATTNYVVKRTDANTYGQLLPKTQITGGNGASPSVVVSHQNMMPYRVVIFAKRTARQYLTAS